MEVVGFAFGVVGLAGPFSKACISGYELLRGAATTAEDAADFRLRVDTEMGLLNLWIKHWVNQHNGRIRGSAQIGEQVCVLAVDILAKIGTLLLDAGKLQAKYGIQVRSGTGLLQGEIQRVGTGLGGEIKRVGTGTSMSAGSERTIVEKGSRIGLSGLEVLNEDDGQGKSKETVNQRLIMSRRSSVTLIQNGATLPSEAPVPSHSTSKKESRIRRWLRKAGFIKSKPQSAKVLMQQGTMNETAFTAIANPAQVTDKDASLQATTPGGVPSPLDVKSTTKHAGAVQTPRLSELDLSTAPMEEVLATLESTKAEVEANLTQVRRLKWTMLDKDKAIQLADELKAWNERLFALLPPRRLDPRGPKRNRHYIVPQRASPIFTGRATALSLLEEAFFGPEHDGDGETEDDEELERQRRAVLYGLGGAGKTQIALKFAEDYRDRFDSIFWVNCSSTVAIEEGFREITGILRLPVGTASNPVSAVKNRLAQLREKNWLLIFDNADDIQLAPYLPQGNHGNILITSRNPRVKQYLGLLDKQPYHVDEMSPQEAQELLLRAARLIDVEQMNQVVTVETQEHAQRIVKTLGYLALAIDQAGAYISNNGTIDTYLDVYESFRADLMEMREFEASGYAYAVYQTWEISFQAVKQKNKAAADLLEVFAYLHHERIPRSLFEAGSVDLGEDGAECYPIQLEDLKRLLALCTSVQATGTIAAAQWRPFHFDNAINQLVSYSLVKKNEPPIDKDLPPTFSIHPLVHSWMRDRKATEESRKTAAQNSTVALLRQAALAPTGQTAYALRSHLQTHIDSWVLSILEIDPLSSSLGPTQRAQIKTIGAFAVVYHEVGRLQLATRLRERVLTWCTKNLSPPSHPDIIKARTVLAETYRRSTVRIPQAQVLDAETVELLMSAPEFGPDHTSTITAKLNLAASLSEAGDRLGALLLEQEVIVSRTRALGPDHIDVAVARGNLGVSLLRLRRYPSAEVELRAAYKQRLAIVGEKHPGTLLSMGNLAGALRGQGRFEEAGELLRRVIEIRTGLLGEDHQDVARAKSNYGYTLFSAGRLEEAEKLEMEAAKALEAKLGPYHAFTMDAMSNLGQVYLKMMEEETQQGTGTELAVLELRNRWEKAQKTLVELVERKRFVLGDTHTSTKEAVKLLVQYYGRVGMNSEAYEFETQFGL